LTIIELVLSLAAILGAAILFTNAVEIMGDRLNLGAGAVGSVLAVGNITGAMVFQSTIPVSIGVLFTSWRLDFISAVAAIFAILSGIVFLGFLLRKAPLKAFYMLGAGSLYIVFVVTAIIDLAGG
jgi:Ca2+/Na+ antiporter